MGANVVGKMVEIHRWHLSYLAWHWGRAAKLSYLFEWDRFEYWVHSIIFKRASPKIKQRFLGKPRTGLYPGLSFINCKLMQKVDCFKQSSHAIWNGFCMFCGLHVNYCMLVKPPAAWKQGWILLHNSEKETGSSGLKTLFRWGTYGMGLILHHYWSHSSFKMRWRVLLFSKRCLSVYLSI